MDTVPTQARRKLALAEAHRATLEEAHFDAITSDIGSDERDVLRGLWAEAMVRETVARIQARQLGAA